MDRSAFSKVVHAVVRQAGGRVIAIIEPGVTPNFIAARIEIGVQSCHVLCSHADDWAFAEAIAPPLAPLQFIDCPAFAGAMQSLFGLVPLTRAALLAPFTGRPGLSDSDVRYWQPATQGDALFNWWD